MKRLFWIALIGILLAPTIARAQSEEVVYYHTDAVGSVRMITNPSGVVLGRYDYTPFGQDWPTDPPAPVEVRQFAGKEHDETGLDYFGARYYDGHSGRFTSVDPVLNSGRAIISPQLWNRYSYAANNPVTLGDPDGREVRYATKELETFFTFVAARNATVRATLGLYSGPGNPDLEISQVALGKDPVDGEVDGDFNASFGFTTDSPPGSQNFERLIGLSNAEINAGGATGNGSLLTSATILSAKLKLNSSLDLTVGGRGVNRRALGVASHELGHADSAAKDPLGHLRLSLPANQMDRGKRLPHDSRQIEKMAEEYRKRVEREWRFF